MSGVARRRDGTADPVFKWRRDARCAPEAAEPSIGGAGGRPAGAVGAPLALPVPVGARVWSLAGATDMRRVLATRAAQTQDVLGQDPRARHLLVFRARRGDPIEMVWRNGPDAGLAAKRLGTGRFLWPSAKGGARRGPQPAEKKGRARAPAAPGSCAAPGERAAVRAGRPRRLRGQAPAEGSEDATTELEYGEADQATAKELLPRRTVALWWTRRQAALRLLGLRRVPSDAAAIASDRARPAGTWVARSCSGQQVCRPSPSVSSVPGPRS